MIYTPGQVEDKQLNTHVVDDSAGASRLGYCCQRQLIIWLSDSFINQLPIDVDLHTLLQLFLWPYMIEIPNLQHCFYGKCGTSSDNLRAK